MSDIFDKTGSMAIATRLRLLSERMTKESEKIFHLYGVEIKPKWYPVFYVISQKSHKSVTQIAKEIGQTHPSVIKIVKEMVKDGLVKESKDIKDKRKTNISFTKKGEEYAKRIEEQYLDTSDVVESMLSQTRHNLWFALEEFERLLDEKSTYPRVLESKRRRELQKVSILSYKEKYKDVYINLNKEWINEYFKMEQEDFESLKNPKSYVLDKGGFIYLAFYEEDVVGTCSLVKVEEDKYELSKMAVSKAFQGKGIAYLLGETIISKAKDLHVKTLFIETNTCLKSAISLYEKLGFKKITSHVQGKFKRSNLQMELIL